MAESKPGKQPKLENTEQPTPPSRSWLSLFNILIGLFVGILLGILGTFYLKGWLPKITEMLLTASYIAFGVLVVSLIAVFGFRDYIARSIFGSTAARAGAALQDAQKAGDYLTDRVTDQLLKDAPEDIRQGARSLIPRLANLLLWARLRNWWWQWLFGIFVAIGGLAGTVLLMNQNELLNNQNALIQRQMSLEEASRRSALIVLMSNIIDKVDGEIEKQRDALPEGIRDTARFHLSPSLIGQIAALSHSFKPYRYMSGDTLIERPLSPERGQLLVTLTMLPLDTTTLHQIYERASFHGADLKGARLSGADFTGAELSASDFSDAILVDAIFDKSTLKMARFIDAILWAASFSESFLVKSAFSKADLIGAGFAGANLTQSNFTGAELSAADFSNSDLMFAILANTNLDGFGDSGADFSGAELRMVNFSGSSLGGVDFANSDLRGTVFWGTDVKEEQLSTAYSLDGAKLPDTIKFNLMKSRPNLFDPEPE